MITKPLILLFIAILTATPLFSQQQEELVPADGAGQLEGGLEVVDSAQTDQTPLPPQPETSLFAEGVVEAEEETSTPSSTTTATTFPQFVFQPPAPMSMEEFIATRSNFCVSFDEGATASWNTRLIKQSGRTNFVFKDFLAGLYFTVRTKNFDSIVPFPLPVELFARVAAYYPLSHTFNDYPQPPVNMLNFGVDFMLAPVLQISFLDYVYLDLAAGFHFLYQKSDRWHYVHLGAVGMVGLQLPLARRWSLLLNGFASIDNANLGSNKHMEPYDLAWQYQASLGVRYSKRSPNPKFYIPSKKNDTHDYEKFLQKEQKKSLRKQQKQWKKEEKQWLKTLSQEDRESYLERSKQLKAEEKAQKKEQKALEKAQKAARKAAEKEERQRLKSLEK